LCTECNNGEYGSWGSVKDKDTIFDYKNLPTYARITDIGRNRIEEFLSFQKQQKLNDSIVRTNFFVIATFAAILLGAGFQFASLIKDRRAEQLRLELQHKNLELQSLQDRINLLENLDHAHIDNADKK
jgi:hypothetical protein